MMMVLALAAHGCGVVPEKPWERAGTEAGQEVVGPDGGVLVWVPAGSFRMGTTDEEARYAVDKLNAEPEWLTDEQPARQVQMGGFWLGKHEVTNAQYRAFCQATGRGFPAESAQGDDHPVVFASWGDAKAYSEHHGLSLPAEAQWEYAARGPESRIFPWGDDWDPKRLCWILNKGPGGWTFPVGSFPSGVSWCGALDMVGNVWEWCADWYQVDYYAQGPVQNPPGPSVGQASTIVMTMAREGQLVVIEGKVRVLRGGSWNFSDPGYFRCAYRFFHPPTYRYGRSGFRCARTVR